MGVLLGDRIGGGSHESATFLGGESDMGDTMLMVPNVRLDVEKGRMEQRLLAESCSSGSSLVDEHVGISSGKEASVTATVLTIFRCFMLSGILFLPKAAAMGGIAFYGCCSVYVFSVTLAGMLMLEACCTEDCATYCDLADLAFGQKGRLAVESAIVLSQIAIFSVNMVFVASNIRDLAWIMHDCDYTWSISMFLVIGILTLVFIPVSWVRRVNYLVPSLTIATVFVLVGVTTICVYVALHISHEGISPDVKSINSGWTIILGTISYSWEGTTLILPIRNALTKESRHKFPAILSYTMITLFCIILAFTSAAYLAFGESSRTIILYNLPFTYAAYTIQFLYALGVALSTPLMMLPASHSFEERLRPLFDKQRAVVRKWTKNAIRTTLVILAFFLSYAGLSELDNFVALVGATCSIPLAYIYPTVIYLKLRPELSLARRLFCVMMLLTGLVAMAFAIFSIIYTWRTKVLESHCIPPQF